MLSPVEANEPVQRKEPAAHSFGAGLSAASNLTPMDNRLLTDI